MEFTYIRSTFALLLVIAFFPTFLLQGCVDLHSHCAESTERQVMTQVCAMTNNGICTSYSYQPTYVSTCVRTECDDGYERIGDKCVATKSSASMASGSNTNKAQLDVAARNAYLSKMQSCKGWKVLSNSDPAASSLIGENFCRDRIQTWLRKSQTDAPSEPNFYPMGPTYQLEFPTRGISLFFSSATDILGSEAIYFDPIKPGIKRYEGKLPLGLSFQHTRKQIETILGRSDSSVSIPAVGCQALYAAKGMIIVYNGEQLDNPNALMRYMIISKNLR